MGSSSLVTAKVTSPPDSRQQTGASRQQSAAVMSSGSRPVSWVNIPITRTVNTIVASVVEELQLQQQQQQQQQGPKRVRWSEELTQVRDISPMYKAAPFRFQSPSRRASPSPPSSYSSSFPPRSSLTSSHLHCSPQLQKVVFRAVNNNNNNLDSNSNSTSFWRGGGHSSGWRPYKAHLSLNIRPTSV